MTTGDATVLIEVVMVAAGLVLRVSGVGSV
jgi:hypothetical protein